MKIIPFKNEFEDKSKPFELIDSEEQLGILWIDRGYEIYSFASWFFWLVKGIIVKAFATLQSRIFSISLKSGSGEGLDINSVSVWDIGLSSYNIFSKGIFGGVLFLYFVFFWLAMRAKTGNMEISSASWIFSSLCFCVSTNLSWIFKVVFKSS